MCAQVRARCYLAPERLTADPAAVEADLTAKKRMDIFSLGCVLAELSAAEIANAALW